MTEPRCQCASPSEYLLSWGDGSWYCERCGRRVDVSDTDMDMADAEQEATP